MTTLSALYQNTRKILHAAGIDSADLDARLLIAHATGCAPEDIVLKPDTPATPDHPVLSDALARRLKGEPVSKIIGHREFYGLDFIVNRDVLDPRADSETLIDAARDHLNNYPSGNILDICTGSGCLLVTLLTLFPDATGKGTDLSEAALDVAHENADRLGVGPQADFIHTSFADMVDNTFDCIVCNPPYIKTGDIESLEASVRLYDPMLALDGGADGLAAYRIVFPQIRKLLSTEGCAFFEIGFDQADDIGKLAETCGLHVRESFRDLNGHERVVELS